MLTLRKFGRFFAWSVVALIVLALLAVLGGLVVLSIPVLFLAGIGGLVLLFVLTAVLGRGTPRRYGR